MKSYNRKRPDPAKFPDHKLRYPAITLAYALTKLAFPHFLKSLSLQKLIRPGADSLLWNVSGSTIIHILLIFGLGFYISLPEPHILRQTISINFTGVSELSDTAEAGAGSQSNQLPGKPREQQNKPVIHTDENAQNFDYAVFVVEQQRLLDEISQLNKVIEESERIGFLGVFDVHPAYRQYQEYWQSYVSQFGTEHYPQSLVAQKLSGSLELDISIDQKGVVRGIDILRSSGNVEIDNAAIEIAMLASPYAPLPGGIAKDIDILHIIRTWEFNNETLVSRARESQ